MQTNFLQLNNPTPYLLLPTIQPIQMPTGPLLLPTQPDNSDPYTIKNYFTGGRPKPGRAQESELLTTPYDDIGHLLRQSESYVENAWKYKSIPNKKDADKTSLIIEDAISSYLHEEHHSVTSNSKPNNILLYIKCYVNQKKMRIRVKTNNSNKIQDLKSIVIGKLKVAKQIDGQVEDSQIYKNDQLLPDDLILEDIDIAEDDLFVHIINSIPSEVNPEFCFVDPSLLPKITKKDYKITPNLNELSNMTEKELTSVENFTVENRFGKVVFTGYTNVLGLNVDEIVQIQQNQIVVYPSEGSIELPEPGNGLNKPAIITLYKCFPKDSNRIDKRTLNKRMNKKLEKVAKSQQAKHIKYDDKTGAWTFSVSHF